MTWMSVAIANLGECGFSALAGKWKALRSLFDIILDSNDAGSFGKENLIMKLLLGC